MVTEKELSNHPVFQKFDTLNLQPDEYAIMGGGTMYALGIRDLSTLDDIDLLITQKGWEKVKDLSEVIHDDEWKCDHIYLFDNQVEIYNGWGPGDYNAEEIIKNAIHIGKYTFADIDTVIRWKTEMGREKDIKHIAMIQEYLENQKKLTK